MKKNHSERFRIRAAAACAGGKFFFKKTAMGQSPDSRVWRSTICPVLWVAICVVLTGVPALLIGGTSVEAQPPIYTTEGPHDITRIIIPQNKSTTLQIDSDFGDVMIGNPKIADIVPLTNRSIYVLGKEIGATRLIILDKNKEILSIVEVEVSYDASELERQLKKHVPHSQIKVSSINGKILLSGQTLDAPSVEKAMSIATQFAPAEFITNALSVNSSQQVLLEVRFIEVSRQADRDLGINWAALNVPNFVGVTGAAALAGSGLGPVFGAANLASGLASGAGPVLFPFAAGGFPSGNTPFGTFLARVLSTSSGATVDVIIQALEERGLARRLAEPNLVALSGDTANFLAGGEFPFPVPQQNDVITIEFKKFGVGLAFTPTVLANGIINLKIEPEVSELDPVNSVTIRGFTVPGLIVRRAMTTVELRDGQSFAIAGLLQFNNRKVQRQLPWIGQVPVLGALFRSASYQRNETDLVIIITPRLVKPRVPPGQRLVTPLDKSVPANDVDFFLMGEQERWITNTGRADLPAGHIIDFDYQESTFKGGDLPHGTMHK